MLEVVPHGIQGFQEEVIGAATIPTITKELNLTAHKVAGEGGVKEDKGNNPNVSEISLVFGPGASALSKELPSRISTAESSPSDASPGKNESSTPLRKPSRGRRRIRNSGRSSLSSPSPIRPPSQKVRLDGEERPVDQVVLDQDQQNDLLDPGEQLADQNASIVKELHQLCDSGDWRDTSFEDEGAKMGGNLDFSAKVAETDPKDGEGFGISPVEHVPDKGPDALNLATSPVEPDPEAQKGL